MWQFTREFIINDNEGKLSGGKRFLGADGVLKVDHMINVKKADVCSAYKAEGQDEAIEVLKIKPSNDGGVTVAKDAVVRLVLTLGQEGRVISTFNDQYPEHSRQFIYEAVVQTANTLPLKDLCDAIKKETAIFESPFFTAALDDESTPTTLTLTALDCYTRFNDVRIVKVPLDSEKTVGAALTGYQDYVALVDADRKTILDASSSKKVWLSTEGSTGKNTTNYIIHNMRLQTAANLNPYGVNMDERPLPKSKYDQYTLELVTERRQVGHQVMGAVDQSLVTVIFFVLSGATSTAFASALSAAGIEVEASTAKVKRIVALAKDVEEDESESV